MGIKTRKGFILFVTVLIWFFIFTLISCSGEFHLRKAQKKAPYLFDTTQVIKYDTIIQPKEIYDTLFKEREIHDTIRIDRDKVRISYVRLPGDTVYLEAEVKEDTCVNKTVTKTRTVTFKEKFIPWYYWVLIGLLLAVIIYLVIRRIL